jgi:hypothetical protein
MNKLLSHKVRASAAQIASGSNPRKIFNRCNGLSPCAP